MTKTEARQLVDKTRDYIPGGKTVSNPQTLQWHPTTELEIHHCGVQTGRDIQSGPYFCGAIADFVAVTLEGGVVAACTKHHKMLMKGR